MATMTLTASTYSVTGTVTVSNPDNMYTDVSSTNYATITHTTSSTSAYYCYIKGFNLSDVPSDAEVSSIVIRIKGRESGLSTSTSYAPRLFNGTTTITGASTASTNFGTSSSGTTITIPYTGTWSTLKGYGSNLGIRVVIRKSNKSTQGYLYIYGAEIAVTYTVPTPVSVTGVSLNKSTTSIEALLTEQLTETVSPSNASNKSVTWSSSNTSVATVNSSGLVTAVAEGTAVITVTTADGGYTYTCTVTVTPRKGHIIVIGNYVMSTETTTDIYVNAAGTYNYYGMDGVEYTSGMYTPQELLWYLTPSGSGYYIQSIDGKYLNATYLSNGSGYNGTIKLDNTPDVWTITGTLDTWEINGSVLHSSNANKNVTHEETSEYDGTPINVFTVRTTGETSYLYDENSVLPTPVSVTGVSLNKSSTSIEMLQTEQLTAIIAPSNASNKSVTWSSSNTSVATVSSSGLVSALTEGTAVITVTTVDGGFTYTCTVTVTPRKGYVIVIGGFAMSTETTTDIYVNAAGTYHYYGMDGVEYTSGMYTPQEIIWYITPTGNGYYIQSNDGRYLNATYLSNGNGNDGTVKLDNTPDVWTITGTFSNWEINGSVLHSTNSNKNLTHEEASEYDGTPINVFTVRTTGETSYLHEENKVLPNALYVKVSNAWVKAIEVYKKINGSWVLQSDVTSVFDPNMNYVRG